MLIITVTSRPPRSLPFRSYYDVITNLAAATLLYAFTRPVCARCAGDRRHISSLIIWLVLTTHFALSYDYDWEYRRVGFLFFFYFNHRRETIIFLSIKKKHKSEIDRLIDLFTPLVYTDSRKIYVILEGGGGVRELVVELVNERLINSWGTIKRRRLNGTFRRVCISW